MADVDSGSAGSISEAHEHDHRWHKRSFLSQTKAYGFYLQLAAAEPYILELARTNLRPGV